VYEIVGNTPCQSANLQQSDIQLDCNDEHMGVHNLWELLSPCGRRVHIDTLEGRVLAVDISIWITQFIKAMRDDEGNLVRNAHIVGTVRRILRLLFHRIRPVFVFDGATPSLKLNTIRARRSLREKQVRTVLFFN
jgi:XPG N-terminal domain